MTVSVKIREIRLVSGGGPRRARAGGGVLLGCSACRRWACWPCGRRRRGGARRVRILTLALAEGPVQDAGGVEWVRGADGAGAVQGDADDGVAVPGRLEQQALPGGPGKAGLDADRARVVAEQRIEVLPQVGVMPGAGGEMVAALVHDRAEGWQQHRG